MVFGRDGYISVWAGWVYQCLVLISCLITKLNHEYIFFEIVNEFNSEETKRN